MYVGLIQLFILVTPYLKKLISFLRIVNIKQQQLIKCPPLTRTMFSIHDLGFREGGTLAHYNIVQSFEEKVNYIINIRFTIERNFYH